MYQNIVVLVHYQHAEYVAEVAKQKSRTPHDVNIPLFAELHGNVSKPALLRIYNELE
jgi:hypothetical protein